MTLTPSSSYDDVGKVVIVTLTNAHATYVPVTMRVEVKSLI